jgi:hypothetical protein
MNSQRHDEYDDHCEKLSALFLAYSILILSAVAVAILTA